MLRYSTGLKKNNQIRKLVSNQHQQRKNKRSLIEKQRNAAGGAVKLDLIHSKSICPHSEICIGRKKDAPVGKHILQLTWKQVHLNQQHGMHHQSKQYEYSLRDDQLKNHCTEKDIKISDDEMNYEIERE